MINKGIGEMNPHRRLVYIVAIVLLLLLPLIHSAAQTIKVATLVPEGSPWHKALIKVAAEWQQISNGRVRLKIYPGGIAGDETDTIRKMRINQIQAALVTGKGLAYIHPDFYVYQIPFIARSDEELDYLFVQLRPELEKILEKKGFTLLAFSKSGWLRFFAKTEATTPEQMRSLKLFSLEGHASVDQAMKAMGFQIVPLKANDAFAAMQSGMVEAFAAAPLVAASMQWFGLAPHMNSFFWSPMTGGLIITNRAWDRIPEDLHPQLLASTEAILTELYFETLEVEKQAFDIMQKNGLIIHSVPDDTLEKWRNIVDRGFSMLIGDTISRDIYDQALAAVEEYRNH
jgi:TRAP-type C4-dicarboxylate transport system substrate-binding protein